MTATDPFTTPAEAEREARVKQAQDFLALAMTPEHLSTWGNSINGHLDYENGIQAVRDAIVGQGYALLSVRDELADIAASLRTLTALPGAVQRVGDNLSAAGEAMQDGLKDVGGEIHDLCATVDQGVEFADSTVSAVASISVSMHDLTDAVDRLAEPRPRWWQRWFRRSPVEDVQGEVSL